MPDNKKTLRETLGTFVKEKRMALGLTTRQLSFLVYGDEKRNSYITDIENGKINLTIDTIGYVLEALQSDIQFVE